MTTTKTDAFDAMLGHHRLLEEHVESRVGAVMRAVADNNSCEAAVAELVACLADEVLPHALAEEHTIYPVAALRGDLSEIVAGMVVEHRALAAATERLADAASRDQAGSLAQEIGTLFSTHVAKENEILLPPLVADDEVDLAQLLVRMHRLTEAAQEETPTSDDLSAGDPEAELLSLLLEATTDLARIGLGDRACRLAASAWVALRVPRPELAVSVTAVLHRLARLVREEPVRFRTTGENPLLVGTNLDVRDLAPAQRHESIFAEYQALAAGAGFVLVNDHDPKPLRYQFEAEHTGQYTWEVLEAGPEVWRVRIGKPLPPPSNEPNGSGSADEPELDVRPIDHGQRHAVIFTTYSALPPAGGFILVNDHDPKPLRYQLEAHFPAQFTWTYLETGPRIWRVRIGRVPRETPQ